MWLNCGKPPCNNNKEAFIFHFYLLFFFPQRRITAHSPPPMNKNSDHILLGRNILAVRIILEKSQFSANKGRDKIMKRTILATLCASFLLTGAVVASPLTDYSQGNIAIDLYYSKPKFDEIRPLITLEYGKKSTWDCSGTFGLGNKLAFQYTQLSPETSPYIDAWANIVMRLKIQEFNVLYQVTPNMSVYSGLVKAQGAWWENTTGNYFPSNTRSLWQFGAQGYTKLAAKLIGFAAVGLGNGYNSYNIGIGYKIAQNLELNAVYDYKKVKHLQDSIGEYGIHTQGMKYGITYKF